MQTFLPIIGFEESAKVLDYRRLGKQRIECWQILNVLRGQTKAWQNHPAVKMWRGYEQALIEYALNICEEWLQRGYKDTMYERFLTLEKMDLLVYPPWFGNCSFHSAHRAALLAKNYEWYSQFHWSEIPEIKYYWPVK